MTVPSAIAVIGISIFMDSRTITSSPVVDRLADVNVHVEDGAGHVRGDLHSFFQTPQTDLTRRRVAPLLAPLVEILAPGTLMSRSARWVYRSLRSATDKRPRGENHVLGPVHIASRPKLVTLTSTSST